MAMWSLQERWSLSHPLCKRNLDRVYGKGKEKMNIDLKDKRLDYCGRIDWEDGLPVFIFPSTSLEFCFWGRKVVLTVENRRLYGDNYAGAVVDGVQKKWLLNPEKETKLVLVDDGQEGEHRILFFKRQDACHEMKLLGMELSEESSLLVLPDRFRKKIEVYGDSICAGEVSEAEEYAGRDDPKHQGEYSNSWYSYVWMAARRLGAKLHNISQGGIPLLNGSGYVEPDYPGMEDIWDKLRYRPGFGPVKEWDFSQYTPDLVIVAVGQNDSYPTDFMKENPDGETARRWKKRYGEFVQKLRTRYPSAVILLMTSVMMHDKSWDDAIGEVCRDLSDDKIRQFKFRENGCRTPGHIRMSEAEEMADELVDYIKNIVKFFLISKM